MGVTGVYGNWAYNHKGGGGSTTVAGFQLYVSNNGSGTQDGLSPANACTFNAVWAKVAAVVNQNPVVNVASGVYQGANNMILPTNNLAGSAASPITVLATVDGGVTIDGQGVRNPFTLNTGNHYFVFTGINVRNSQSANIIIGNNGACNNNLLQRMVSYDASDAKNCHLLVIAAGSVNNVVEDYAGFGKGRKCSETQSTNGPNTFRRCWERWQRSTTVGPKMASSLIYASYNVTIENCLTTFDDSYLPNPYTLTDANGNVQDETPQSPGQSCLTISTPYGVVQAGSPNFCSVNSSVPEQGYGCFAMDHFTASTAANSQILGSIAYQKIGQTFNPGNSGAMFYLTGADSVLIKDCIALMPAGFTYGPLVTVGALNTFGLYNGTLHSGLVATNLTSFKGSASSPGKTIGTDWAQTNVQEALTPSALYTGPGETMYTTTKGAAIRYRYVNGVLTNTPLWPWPMNQRIKDACTAAGYAVEDVNATMQGYFGTFQ